MRPPFDLAAVDAASVQVLADGHRILQTHRFGASDRDHVEVLLDILSPPEGGIVLDAGCGVGEVSRIMSALRPDLSFILMNVSMYQLAQCPVGDQFLHALDDCHATLIRTGYCDVVMFSSALCQMDIAIALAEAHRMLKPGGILLINDMVRTSGSPDPMEAAIAARVLTQDDLLALVSAAGLNPVVWTPVKYNDTHFQTMLAQAGYADLGVGIEPVIIRAIKGE